MYANLEIARMAADAHVAGMYVCLYVCVCMYVRVYVCIYIVH